MMHSWLSNLILSLFTYNKNAWDIGEGALLHFLIKDMTTAQYLQWKI